VTAAAATAILAGIIAKGFGVIGLIFLAGLIIGIVLTFSITRRLHRRR